MKKRLISFLLLALIPLYISGCSGSEVKPESPVSSASLPPPAQDVRQSGTLNSRNSNLIQEVSSRDWFFHQENAVNPRGELYCTIAYITKKESKYTFDFLGYSTGVGSFTKDEFIYKIGEIEYHYPLSMPIHEHYILGDFEHDGQNEWLQDDGKEIFVQKKEGKKFSVHQISDIALKETRDFFYAPVLVQGLNGYAILVADPSANGFDTIHIYNYSPKSQTFLPLNFEYPDGKKEPVFYGHMRRTEPGGLVGAVRDADSEGNWTVTFYNISYEKGILKANAEYKEPGGWPIWWAF